MARKPTMFALLASMALSFSLSSCGDREPSTVLPAESTPGSNPSPTQMEPDQELVSLKTMGGMCVEGACSEDLITVSGDGTWLAASGSLGRAGKMSSDQLDEMMELISQVDDSVEKKAEEFCESWVDGRDDELIIMDETGIEQSFSTCTHDMSQVELLPFLEEVTSE